jgi:hypothetical protein
MNSSVHLDDLEGAKGALLQPAATVAEKKEQVDTILHIFIIERIF